MRTTRTLQSATEHLPSIKNAKDRTPLALVPDYAHVGLHKTGTTFLQKTLFPLLEPEIRYVRKSEALFLDGQLVTNRPHVIAAFGQPGGDAAGPFLLSQEALAGGLLAPDLTAPRTLAALNPQLRVIVSLRAQHTIIPSMYFQAVKTGYRGPLDQFADELSRSGKLDYAGLIDELGTIIGRDRILVLLFEEFTNDPAIAFARLCRFLGLTKSMVPIAAERQKASASDDAILAKRLCNRLRVAQFLGVRTERWTHQVLAAGLRTLAPRLRQHGEMFQLSPQQAERVAARYAAGNAKVLAAHGYDAFAHAYRVGTDATSAASSLDRPDIRKPAQG